MLISLRPSLLSDLEYIIAFAEEASLGITSLPQNPSFLEKRLHAAQQAEKTGVYLFSLTENSHVIGLAGFVRHTEKSPPLLVYEKKQRELVQEEVHIRRSINTLELRQLPTPFTEIGSLFLKKEYRGKHLGPLLSYSRFLFMANFPEQSDDTLIASLRGINYPNGSCPFWDAFGTHFYDQDFRQADYLRSEHYSAMHALFPQTPIYINLLPYSAQKAIGKTHALTQPAKKMLLSQGFKITPYVDLFDAGPYLQADRQIRAIKDSVLAQVHSIQPKIETPASVLICNHSADFRCAFSQILGQGDHVILDEQTATLLNVRKGDSVRYLPRREF